MVSVGDFAKTVDETTESVRWRIATHAEPWATSPQAKEGGHRRFSAVHAIGWTAARLIVSQGATFEQAAEAVRLTEAAERYLANSRKHLAVDLWLGLYRIAYRDADGTHVDVRHEIGTASRLAEIAAREAQAFARPRENEIGMGCEGVVFVNLVSAFRRARETAVAAGFELSGADLRKATQ